MASRVKELAGHLIGRKLKDPGAHMYHAADAVAGGGFVNEEQRHRMRRALYRQRLRATGMTDNLFGSKEVGGTLEDPREQEV